MKTTDGKKRLRAILASFHPGNLLLLAGSLLVTSVGAEFLYRLTFFTMAPSSYRVYSNCVYAFDSTQGYQYSPNTQFVSMSVVNGLPAFYESQQIGPDGTTGKPVTSWSDSDFKILVFGDSFTSNLNYFHSWADHIAEPLGKSLGKRVQVMNLARTGYGVKQMVSLAAKTVQHTKADLVLIAYIVDDLSRARTWRAKMNIDGRDRVFMTVQQSETPDPEFRQDADLIEPLMSAEWCKQVVEGKLEDDPLLQSINRQYKDLLPLNLDADYLWSPKSMLYNQIRHGDPTHDIRKLPPTPRLAYTDFRDDAEFVRDNSVLRERQVPVLFMLLPTYWDLQNGKHEFSNEQQSLHHSLEKLTGNRIADLLDSMKTKSVNLDSCFLATDNFHPAEAGAQWYAENIVKIVQAEISNSNN